MKQTILIFSILFIISCGASNKSELAPLKSKDTTYTTLIWALDVSSNEYRVTTAMRIVKDTVMADVEKKTFQNETDTSFLVWLPEPKLDSLKRILKTASGKDSIEFKWFNIDKELILYDANKKWKVNKKP